MITLASETAAVKQEYAAWVVDTDADKRDVVMIALTNGYVSGLERATFRDDMYAHMRECKATLRRAHNVEMVLSQAEVFGERWGLKR